eukprot:1046086-Ditylum_brightwellii.AAC.1
MDMEAELDDEMAFVDDKDLCMVVEHAMMDGDTHRNNKGAVSKDDKKGLIASKGTDNSKAVLKNGNEYCYKCTIVR